MPLTTWYLQRLLFYPSVLSVIITLSSSIRISEVRETDGLRNTSSQKSVYVVLMDTCGLFLRQPKMILLCHIMAVMWWRPSLCEPQPHLSPNTNDGRHWRDLQTSAAIRQDVVEATDVFPTRLMTYLLVFLDVSDFCFEASEVQCYYDG